MGLESILERKIHSLIIAVVISATIMLSGFPTSASASGTKAFTIEGWKPGMNDIDLQYQAAHYDFLIADGCSYYNSKVGYLHQLNPSMTILAYQNGLVKYDTDDDYAALLAQHPDWFLRDTAGNLVREKYYLPNVLMNPNSPGWRDYVNARIRNKWMSVGYDGIFLDVIVPWIDLDGYIYYTAPPVNPATGNEFTNGEWTTANREFLASIKRGLGDKLLIFNGVGNGYQFNNFKNENLEMVGIADGAYAEGFLRWSDDGIGYPKSETEWKRDVDMVAAVAVTGKQLYVESALKTALVPTTSAQLATTKLYSLSSYLLAANGNSRYMFLQEPYPDAALVQSRDAMTDIDIGTATSAYVKSGNVYRRNFTDGIVLVNPTDGGSSSTVALDGIYVNSDGIEVTSVTLPPKTGTVLVRRAYFLHATVSKPIFGHYRGHRTFTVTTYLKPRQSKTSKSVRIFAYRWITGRNAHWSLHKAFVAPVVSWSASASKHCARVSLPHNGKWKLVVVYAGGSGYAKASGTSAFLTIR